MEMYDFEELRVIEEITRNNYKKVLLQLPDGLKKEAMHLSNSIRSKTGAEVIVSGSSCWGGCDLALEEVKSLNCDFIVHFGHTPFVKSDFPTLYIELKSNINVVSMVKDNLKSLGKYKKIGLVSSIQYIHKLNEIKKRIEKENKTVLIPKKKGFAYYNGHVIGCEYRHLKEIDVDCFLVVGNKFHSLGVALTVNKDVLLLDEKTGKLENMNAERNKIIKQRAIAIAKVKKACNIGIIIGLKPGQKNPEIAKNIQKELEKQEKETVLIVVNEITPSNLMSFYNVDAFIITACPRIAIEDYGKYEKPIINSREAKVVTGELTWDDLLEEGFL